MARATSAGGRLQRDRSCSASRPPAPISLGKLAMTQLAWGMMGQTPGRPAVPQPARPRARARRLVVGLGRGGRDGHRRPRARHRRRRQRAASGRGLRRRRVQADLRLGPARRLHAVRAELRHRRGDRAHASPRRRCSTRSSTGTPPAELGGGLDGLRVAFLGGYFTAALEDDVADDARARARARARAARSTSPGRRTDNRAMSPIFTAEPGAFVLAHDPHPDPALYDPTTFADVEASRALPAIEYLQGRASARRGSAALRGRGRRLRHPAVRLGALPARPASTAPTRRRA